MTDEERVKAKWPDVKWCSVDGWFHIFSPSLRGRPLGMGKTKSAAWADAAKRLEEN